jgi:hypothetical protein
LWKVVGKEQHGGHTLLSRREGKAQEQEKVNFKLATVSCVRAVTIKEVHVVEGGGGKTQTILEPKAGETER